MISSIYQSSDTVLTPMIRQSLASCIEDGLVLNNRPKFFFRADDIGVPSKNYSRMMALFLKYEIPLCLAVVPTWLTRKRWEAMNDFVKKGQNLFCWHMHGYRHMNYEVQGKKQEFGPIRSSTAVFNDISRGRKTLQSILGDKFTPIFTPPWNRCSLETMQVLKEIGFKGISRSYGSLPLPPAGLEDFPIHVDLHTRKEKTAEQGWQKLFKEITRGMQFPACGIMIHHMRMNEQAFVFLKYLLECLAAHKQARIITFNHLI
ncbi:MAG: polysaccharide deacetylase family protein [Desulfobacula sp.]|uniref:polysaccharide deacetylase family protein n=1 Tax=Desulfobacula sp. TaxID=2593537 RepID=UPI0025B8C377|nr:polysaccharide deacetylase family protein [Desulfobacula sp.]MCD4720346.1 polysaccharide deacetylase family protein [Desulfobacula sp.]